MVEQKLQINVRWSSKSQKNKMQGGRAKVKQKMQGGPAKKCKTAHQKNVRWK
jgi:hypothetical protein